MLPADFNFFRDGSDLQREIDHGFLRNRQGNPSPDLNCERRALGLNIVFAGKQPGNSIEAAGVGSHANTDPGICIGRGYLHVGEQGALLIGGRPQKNSSAGLAERGD